MNRTILLIFLLLISMEMMAQSSLDIGDIKIFGEEISEQDSLRDDSDLSAFWKIDDLEKFNYEPDFSRKIFPEAFPAQDKIAFDLQAGSTELFDLKAIYSGKIDLLFTSEYYNWNEDWNRSENSFFLSVGSENWLTSAEIDYDIYHADSITTQGKSAGFNLNLNSDPTKNILKRLNVNTDFCDLEQADRKFSELNFRSDFDLAFLNLNSKVKVSYLRSDLFGSFQLGWERSSFLKDLALWLGADRKMILPSLSIQKRFFLNDKNQIKLFNLPQISETSRSDELKQNVLLTLDMKKQQTKKPVNANIVFLNNTFFAKSFYYNFQWLFDQQNYTFQDSFYNFDYQENHLHKIGFRLRFEINDLYFEEDISYWKFDRETAYEANYHSMTSFGFKNKKYDFMAKFHYMGDREDAFDSKLDDLISLDIYAAYKISEKWSITTQLENILNDKVERWEYYPENKINFSIGTQFEF